MKKIILVIALLLIAVYGNSQTTLTTGDIAFVGSNTDGATNADDTIAFVLLKDIDAATTIIFTDMGWNDGTGFFATNGDGQFTWTSGVARTAGDVVTINMTPLVPASYSYIGDQMFAIQGSIASPVFIAGLQFNDTSGDDANWDGAATSNSTSALPNALVTGDTAVRLVPEQDNWQFSCAAAGGPVSGTAAQIRAIVNDRTNWVSNNTTPYNPALEAGCAFTVSTGGDTTPPVITCAATPAPITAGTNGMAAIPDLVSGTTATDDVSAPGNITITQSPTAGTMVGVGVYNVILTATDEAGNNATCTIVVTINEPPFTILNAGDIAFVGFNLDGNDGFAFIILKDIIAGTNIKFTDCGVSNPNTITCAGSGGDGSATWYAPSAMSAGDIVTLSGSFMSASVLSSIGDQLFAYQGTAASPNFITGIHSNVDPGGTTDADWDGANTSNTTSALPDQLTNGVNAIRLYAAGTPETEVDNWQFDCSAVPGGFPITGTAIQLAAIINDIQYWTSSDTVEFVPAAKSGCGYSVVLTSFTAPADLCVDAGVQTGLGGGTPTGGVYSGPGVTDDGNGTTYSFDPATAGVGTHTLTYTESGNSATDDVEVFALDDPSFNYSAASYCVNDADPTPTITGLGGGTFSSGAGLSVNASTGTIDVSASTPGTYTVTYTTAGTCPNSSDVSVTINALDDPSFNYDATAYCANEADPTPTITGLGGGTFSSGAGLSVNASTGTIDVSASTPGTYTVTYTTAGACPNSSNVSVTINALDDPSFNYDAAAYCANGTDPTPTITGLGGGTFSSGAGLSINASTGTIDLSASTPGTYTVTYTTAGTCPNSSNVNITVNALPTVTFSAPSSPVCPGGVLTGQGGGAPAGGIYSGPGVTDDGNGTTYTFDAGAAGNGTHTLTYTFSDVNGCINSASDDVTVEDTTPPAITCPGDITQDNDTGICGAVVTYTAPVGTDNCSGATTSQTAGLASGSTFPVGTTTNTFMTTDASGNTTSCSFDVTVNDTEAPSITCPGDTTQDNDPGVCGAVVTFANPTITDNCGESSGELVVNGTADDGLNGWNITQNGGDGWAVTGNNKFITSWSYCVKNQIIDLMAVGYSAATLDASPDIVVSEDYVGGWPNYSDTYFYNAELRDENGVAIASYSTGNLTCTSTVQTVSHTFSGYPPGVRYIYIEHGGKDTEFWAGHYGAIIDNSKVMVQAFIVNQTAGLPSGSTFPVGTTTNTFVVTDASGNTATCSFDVTINDNEAPVANCAAPFTIQLDANGEANITVADIENGSTDACGIASTSIDITDFDCSNVGPNTVTLTVTDNNGNTSTCSTIVTVEDSIPPTIACPADITANTDPGDCFATVSFSDPVALDNCGVDTIVQTAGLPSGSQFPVGVNTVEFTATDVNGNASTCSFTITVTDNEAPIAVCQNITIQLDANGNASITAADVDGGSTDQCGVASVTIDMDTFDCSNVGDNNVTLTVTDVNGNTSTCTAIVTVEDVTVPVVSCQNITVELDANGTVTIQGIDIDNGSTDACGIASYDLDIDTFDCSNVGDNTVTLTVTDVNGNSDTCTAIVTVEDNTAPVLVCQDFTIEIGADGTATLDPSDVIASNDDACGILTVAVDITEFSCADIGTPVTVQIFSQDNNGNLSTCTATVTAVDLLAPEITCPADQTVDPGAGNLFYIVPDYFATGEATAIDNCTDPVTITSQDPAVGTALPDGTYTITLTAEDEYGNIGTCGFELTVDTTLGAGDHNQSLGTVQLYPNPSNSIVNIGNPNNLDLQRASIYDLRGRMVQTIDLRGMGRLKPIDINQLSVATYMMIIESKQGRITKRLMKN